jgi:hypothetical protein
MDILTSEEMKPALQWALALYFGSSCLTTFLLGLLIGRLL